jgi:WD40 repeat protein
MRSHFDSTQITLGAGVVPTLRLLQAGTKTARHAGEVFACCFSPDGRLILSAGWDGYLRLWDAHEGEQVHELQAGSKPLAACAVSPDGRRWLSGSMDGMLAQWDAQTHKQALLFMAHTRPISAIVFSGDGTQLATCSWDRQLTLRTVGSDGAARTLSGHADIVAGCRFLPDDKSLVSWSYDATVRIWEVARARLLAEMRGHGDRVTAGGVCPDGRWLATGARDRQLKLWDLAGGRPPGSLPLQAEPRACLFLLDGESLVTVEGNGRLTLVTVPDLEVRSEVSTRLAVQCAELSPAGDLIALGCTDGAVCLVAVDGFDDSPLVVTPTQTSRTTANLFQRLLGTSRVTHAFRCTCPACRQTFELPGSAPGQSACPYCHRPLRFAHVTQAANEAAGRRQ